MNIFWLTGVHQEIVNLALLTPGTPRTPPGGGGRDGRTVGPRGGGVNIRIYVYTQLQAPGSRLRTPNGAFKIGPKAYH